MRAKIFILSFLIINAYSISNERVSNYHKQGIKKFLVFDNEYENRPNGRTFHTLNNRTDNRTHPKPHNRTDPTPKPDNRTDPSPKPDNRTDNRTDPTPKPDNKTDNRTDPSPKPDNRTDNRSNIELVAINTNAIEHSIMTEDFLLVFRNYDTNPRLIHSITIKKYSNGSILRLPLYYYKKENIYFASCLGDVRRIESDLYFVTGIEYGNEFINLKRSFSFYIINSHKN